MYTTNATCIFLPCCSSARSITCHTHQLTEPPTPLPPGLCNFLNYVYNAYVTQTYKYRFDWKAIIGMVLQSIKREKTSIYNTCICRGVETFSPLHWDLFSSLLSCSHILCIQFSFNSPDIH